jgi:hypothetical protein
MLFLNLLHLSALLLALLAPRGAKADDAVGTASTLDGAMHFILWHGDSERPIVLSPTAECTIRKYHRYHPTDNIVLWTDFEMRLPDGFATILTLAALDTELLFDGTPLAKWTHNMKLASALLHTTEHTTCQLYNQNMANALRLAILYKYGGRYMDLDIITINEFPTASPAVSAQAGSGPSAMLNNCLLIFPQHSPCLLDMMENFKSNFKCLWGNQGPQLMDRVYNHGKNALCSNMTIHGHHVFSPVHYTTAKATYGSMTVEDVDEFRRNGTVAMHLYHGINNNENILRLVGCDQLDEDQVDTKILVDDTKIISNEENVVNDDHQSEDKIQREKDDLLKSLLPKEVTNSPNNIIDQSNSSSKKNEPEKRVRGERSGGRGRPPVSRSRRTPVKGGGLHRSS